MDLLEAENGLGACRHPWELSRARAVQRILKTALPALRAPAVLDVGCGDGFALRSVQRALPADWCYTAVDSELTQESLGRLQAVLPNTNCCTSLDYIAGQSFDLILLLDVLEHVEDDGPFLQSLVREQLAPGGYLLLASPAFQFLYGGHDRFLNHLRRYSRGQLLAMTRATGLEQVTSGYLFSSLLVPRSVSILLQLIGLTPSEYVGVGDWRYGPAVTRPIEWALNMDNLALLGLSGLGLTIPGLSAWTLCRKQA